MSILKCADKSYTAGINYYSIVAYKIDNQNVLKYTKTLMINNLIEETSGAVVLTSYRMLRNI